MMNSVHFGNTTTSQAIAQQARQSFDMAQNTASGSNVFQTPYRDVAQNASETVKNLAQAALAFRQLDMQM